MNFEYISYEQDIFKTVLDDKPKIYIFEKASNRNIARELYYESMGLKIAERSLFLTVSELREKIFLTDKIVLKEEKPVLLFYQALSRDLKKKMGVENYYDVIDTAENFLGFYRLLNEYQIDKLEDLENWQDEVYRDFQEIKISFDGLLGKYSYTLQSEIEKLENIDISLICDYDEIVFVNKFDFSPLEKGILSKLSSEFDVKIVLQVLEGDFDEEDLTLKQVSCPEALKSNIKIFKSRDKFMQLINFISTAESNEYEVMDADAESQDYAKILCKNLMRTKTDVRLSESTLFNFLSKWHHILEGSEYRDMKLHIRIDALMEALNSEEFSNYYKIDADEYREFLKLVSWDYKYATKSFIDELVTVGKLNLGRVACILSDITKLYSLSTLKQFTDFLGDRECFDFQCVDDFEFADIIPKYFEALSEVLSIEEMGILDTWDSYFSNSRIAEGLFRLILKYLRHKPISYAKFSNESTVVNFESLLDGGDIKRDKLIMLNIYEGMLPSKAKNSFLLTDSQKEKLGIPTQEQSIKLEKYNFFRHIFSCEDVIVFGIENEEKNIDMSSFVEELKFVYGLEYSEPEYSEEDCIQAVREMFKSHEFIISSKELLGDSYAKRLDNMQLLHEDFNGNLDISSYSYGDLLKCRYYFFLKRLVKVQEEIFSPEYKIDAKLLGIISHNFMEMVAKLKTEELKSGNFSVSRPRLEAILEEQLAKSKLKVPVDYLKYYKKIIFPIMLDGAVKFYSELEKKFSEETIETFVSEMSGTAELIEESEFGLQVNLTGRMDLLIETESSKNIYDYKTGKGDISQLDFYSILFYGEGDLAKKYIYNMLENKLISDKPRKNVLSRDSVRAEVEDFLRSSRYARTQKVSACRNCEYRQICQMRWDNE